MAGMAGDRNTGGSTTPQRHGRLFELLNQTHLQSRAPVAPPPPASQGFEEFVQAARKSLGVAPEPPPRRLFRPR